MGVTQKWLDLVMSAFFENIEPDEREDVGVQVREAGVNAILASVDDPDPTDTADAIWECIPNADSLDDEYLVDLLDLVDQHWDSREGASA